MDKLSYIRAALLKDYIANLTGIGMVPTMNEILEVPIVNIGVFFRWTVYMTGGDYYRRENISFYWQ